MKKITLLLVGLILLSSCEKYSQVVSIKPKSEGITKAADHCYEFENEDLKVRYSFWAEHGIMGFRIYNKTDHPIYIDWKKSSMISGDVQKQYYTDKTTSNFVSYGHTYGNSWQYAFGKSGHSSNSVNEGSETVTKQERISFISPKSLINHAFYNLVANIYFDVNNRKTSKATVQGQPVYVSVPGDEISFRNYLTYSDKENFETEKHVDNGFRVSKVYTMKSSYLGANINDNFTDCDWYSPECFYIYHLNKEDVFK